MHAPRIPIVLATALLSACVTINVYFPAAEAQEAAREFVNDVIGSDAPAAKPIEGGSGGMALIDFLIPSAQAQNVDIDISTPEIKAIQARMAQRYQSRLAPLVAAGAIGFAADGSVQVRDLAAVALRDRAGLPALVAEENRDRNAVYREIAVANGHPEWESQIRETFARQWQQSAPAGAWIERGGAWTRK